MKLQQHVAAEEDRSDGMNAILATGVIRNGKIEVEEPIELH